MPANSDPPTLESVEERPVTFGTVVVRSVTSRTRFPVALVCLALVPAGCTGLCAPQPQAVGPPEIWNPLPGFEDVNQDGQVGNVQTVSNYYRDAAQGALPSVSWIVPNAGDSEHPPASIATGQAWGAGL